jgi:Tfp pilus assembly protein PilV
MKKYYYSHNSLNIRRGFTLIELLIYMGLLTIFLTVLAALFTSIISATLESKATSGVEQDSRFIVTRLSYDIKRADEIVTPAAIGSQGSTLQLTTDSGAVTYSLQNGNLELTTPSGTSRINSINTQVSAITFRRVGNLNGRNTIVIDLTITSSTKRLSGSEESKNIHTSVGVRY